MRIMFDELKYVKTYATYARAKLEAEKKVAENTRVIIAATPEGRFFPVVIGQEYSMEALHVWKLCCTC